MPDKTTTESTRRQHEPNQLIADAREATLLGYLRLRALRPENRTNAERQADRGVKATALAPTLDICRALLRGERIHWARLDAAQAPRYGIRDGRRRKDGLYALDDFNDVRR